MMCNNMVLDVFMLFPSFSLFLTIKKQTIYGSKVDIFFYWKQLRVTLINSMELNNIIRHLSHYFCIAHYFNWKQLLVDEMWIDLRKVFLIWSEHKNRTNLFWIEFMQLFMYLDSSMTPPSMQSTYRLK